MNDTVPGDVPSDVKKAFDEADKYFPTPLQLFQFVDKYSRYDYEKGRRETWIETVDRVIAYFKNLSENKLSEKDYDTVRKYILEMKVAPAMRVFAMAGPAAERDSTTQYNCSYCPIDSLDSFVEELYISFAGCGIGYSVERKYIDKLPIVLKQTGEMKPTYKIPDSTEGWATAFKKGLVAWFHGKDIEFDFSQIRPSGTPLKVKGGRASGPEPLKDLLSFTRNIILKRQEQRIRPIDAHDVLCKLGECVVSGAVRRSALICLFDHNDVEMRECKNGTNIIGNEQRYMANNSLVWNTELTQDKILKQMWTMFEGQRGEPGIFSRKNANENMPEARKRFGYQSFGTNPCGEINLREFGFCNLSQVIVRPNDTVESLKDKARIATIIGTIQSMATNFPHLRPIWKQNAEEERLLGVDLNGQVDSPLLRPSNPDNGKIFEELKDVVIKTNKIYAKKLGINQSASVTCVKPNGNASLLYDCSPGLHTRWAPYYVRNVRVNANTPMYKVLKECNVPMSPENGQTEESAITWVVHFPVKSPDGALCRNDLSAVEQCEFWKTNKLHWTTHNPSVTISYEPDEIIDLIAWVDKNKNIIGGMSFLPKSDAQYSLMPYEEITKEEYEERIKAFPQIDFSLLIKYENTDLTSTSNELACASGVCSIDEHRAMEAAKSAHLV